MFHLDLQRKNSADKRRGIILRADIPGTLTLEYEDTRVSVKNNLRLSLSCIYLCTHPVVIVDNYEGIPIMATSYTNHFMERALSHIKVC